VMCVMYVSRVYIRDMCGVCSMHIHTITCSICYDRADDSSIHRGTYHILVSTCVNCLHCEAMSTYVCIHL